MYVMFYHFVHKMSYKDLILLNITRYELYVGQPPFYTNSVYALIRHIVKVSLITF